MDTPNTPVQGAPNGGIPPVEVKNEPAPFAAWQTPPAAQASPSSFAMPPAQSFAQPYSPQMPPDGMKPPSPPYPSQPYPAQGAAPAKNQKKSEKKAYKTEKKDKSAYAIALYVAAAAVLFAALLFGCIAANVETEVTYFYQVYTQKQFVITNALPYWMAGFVSAALLCGMAEIVRGLHALIEKGEKK